VAIRQIIDNGRTKPKNWTPEAEHSGPAPRHLGEQVERPKYDALKGLACTLTLREYYAFRYGCAPPPR
jgi:hypothetical protein